MIQVIAAAVGQAPAALALCRESTAAGAGGVSPPSRRSIDPVSVNS